MKKIPILSLREWIILLLSKLLKNRPKLWTISFLFWVKKTTKNKKQMIMMKKLPFCNKRFRNWKKKTNSSRIATIITLDNLTVLNSNKMQFLSIQSTNLPSKMSKESAILPLRISGLIPPINLNTPRTYTPLNKECFLKRWDSIFLESIPLTLQCILPV